MTDQWMTDSGELGNVVIECGVGDTVRICHSSNFRAAQDSTLVSGFRLSYPNMGSLSESSSGGDNSGTDGWNCAEYHHKFAGTQVIEFTEDMSRRRSYIQVNGNIPLHDHASISQGGPAYATYYSEIEEDEEGE